MAKEQAGTKVLACSCPSAYQDAQYGKGSRVHNWGPKAYAGKTEGWRCTVCGASKPA